ncbi:hypothetical protein QVD17_12129 [Tagetes erecta]|uniref:Uncharacterized protein n=1 Tax=Tagetes erecta TaxID=13708 RepID=A0AAD8P2R8_TARER|nr:hypothetical protein QVD17_12129 [Tagetes erecta]
MSHHWVKNGNRVSTEYVDGVKEFLNELISHTQWVYHGEDEVNEEDVGHDDFVNEESVGLRSGIEDAIGHPVFNIGPTNDLTGNQQTEVENARSEKLHEALNNPLYEECKNSSTLTFVVKLMNLKEESSELPPFHPTEELPNTYIIVRKDVEPETLPYEAVASIRTTNAPVEELEDTDDEGVDHHKVKDTSRASRSDTSEYGENIME